MEDGISQRRVLWRARVVFNDGRSTIDCIVRTISETGALLKVASVVEIPSGFILDIKNRGLYQCRIVGAGVDEIGVEFLPTP